MNQKVKSMVGVALLIALVIVLQFLGAMIPPVGGFSISLVLIPIVIGAAVYGPGSGALLGGVFGAIVTINCVNGSDVGGAMVFQANPALCILVVMGKGILAGLAAGWVYRLLKGKNAYVAMLCCAIVCPVVNTGVFLLGCSVFFMDTIKTWALADYGENVVGYLFLGLAGVNFLVEVAINVLLTPAIVRLLDFRNKKKA